MFVGQEQDLDVSTAAKVGAFVCNLYPILKSKERTTDELRQLKNKIFCNIHCYISTENETKNNSR